MNEIELKALELKGQLDALTEKANNAVNKEAFTQEVETLKGLLTNMTEKTAQDLEHVTEQLNQLKEANISVSAPQSLVEVVDVWLKDNYETLKSNYKANKGIVKLDMLEKAVGNMTSANITLPTPLPAGLVAQDQGVPRVSLRYPLISDHVNSFRTNQKTLTYVEASAGEGDFAVVAEGGLKPQLDLDFVERFVQPTKFAGWIKVTDELMEDYPRMRDVIVTYLVEKHNLFKESQILAYMDANSTAYVPTTNPLSGQVIFPNIMDVVAALQAQILNSPNYTDEADFMGDTILMNRGDFFRMFGAAKDALGRPLYAQGYQANRVFSFNGYTFVSSSKVPAGTIYAYDSRKIDVTSYIPYHVQIGYVNDDFIRNQFVILGESRGHIYIKEHDKRAFVKGNINTILADINQPTPAPAGGE